MRRIGIYNNKGGVAKTTSVINLAYGLQKHDKKVLVVDCDAQENCFSFFLTSTVSDQIFPTDYKNISHTTWELYNELAEDATAAYDYILFDMPPAMSDEVKSIIRHCHSVYVPTILGEFEISGLKNVTEEINRQGVQLGGVFVTMYQKQNDEELIEQCRQILQDRMLQSVIPYSKTVRESLKNGMPIEAYFRERAVPPSQTAWKIVHAYEDLTNEIMRGE